MHGPDGLHVVLLPRQLSPTSLMLKSPPALHAVRLPRALAPESHRGHPETPPPRFG